MRHFGTPGSNPPILTDRNDDKDFGPENNYLPRNIAFQTLQLGRLIKDEVDCFSGWGNEIYHWEDVRSLGVRGAETNRGAGLFVEENGKARRRDSHITKKTGLFSCANSNFL